MQGPPAPGQINPEELRPVKCAECGSVRFKPLVWTEHVRHYLDPKIRFRVSREAWLCLGCDRQVSDSGATVHPDDSAWLSPEEREKLGGINAEKA